MSGQAQKAEPTYLRIGELAERSGVSVSTIKYYIREGLLPPPPVKTGRTMGYYDEAYLERLRLVRRLREEHFLPVRVIRLVLADHGDQPLSSSEAAVLARVAPTLASQVDPASREMSPAEARERFSLSIEQLELLREMGLIAERGDLHASDVELLEAMDRAERAGLSRDRFPVEGLGNYLELLGELARREVRSFTKRTATIAPDEVDRLAAQALALTEPIVVLIRRKLILRALRSELERRAKGKKEAP